MNPLAQLTIAALRLYQRTLSPDHGWRAAAGHAGACRFYPSCSQYAIDAIQHGGLLRGSWRAIGRLLRCNPWSLGGVDPA